MKKSLMVFVCLLAMVSISYAGSYDNINKKPEYQQLVGQGYNSGIGAPNNVNWLNYFNCLVKYNDIIALAKSGELDKDKSSYLMNGENANMFVRYLHTILASQFPKSVDERQIVYVTGVIKSKHSVAATTSTEMQVEKQVLRGFPAYSAWEKMKEPGFLAILTNEQLDKLYKFANK
jgi:hypothetical protein